MCFAIFLTAFTIKLVDDFLDNDAGIFTTLINKMKSGILPYAIVIMSFAFIIEPKTSVSLFLSAYIIGMFNDLNRILTFGLKGYQETIVVGVLGLLLIGMSEMISSLIIIFILQLLDDLVDYRKDKIMGKYNLAIKFGKIEVEIFIIILLLIAVKISLIKLVYCLIIFLLFQIYEFYQRS
jgi:hypothetical protein